MNEDEIEDLNARGQHTVSMRRILIEQEDKQIRDLISFATALMSILGILAGFGFTAFQYIEIPPLFFFGEFLMIISIFYLGSKIKRNLVSWSTQTSDQIYDYAEDAAKIKKAILGKNESEMKKLAQEFKISVEDTSSNPRIIRAQKVDGILTKTFWIGLVGIVCIIFSFFHIFC